MFGFRLRVPARGDDITADWARELVKAVRSLRLHAGPGIRLTRTPDGTTISAPAAPSAEAPRTDAAIHFGDAEDAETRTDWQQSEEVPAILYLDNRTRYKLLVDSRGNIMSFTSASEGEDGEEGEEPDDPSPPDTPPPCGNPLNKIGDNNPLDHDDHVNDRNPLDYEGDGGFTPTCYGEDAA